MNRFNYLNLGLTTAAAACCLAGTPAPSIAQQPSPAVPSGDARTSVSALETEVLENNPELRFYRAEIDAARGGLKQAGRYPNPELSTELGGKRVRGGELSAEGVAWSASVRQSFEFPGRIGLRKAIANRDVLLAEIGLDQFQAELKARARVAGYNLWFAQQRAEASSEVANRLQELLSFLVQREPAGIAPLIELRIIEASVVTFRKQAIEANQALQAALFEVNSLRGSPLAAPLRIAADDPAYPPLPTLETLLASAGEKNFDVRTRLAELEQQGIKLSLSENRRWPEFSLGPFVSQERAGERETVAGMGISLPLPLWHRSAGDADVQKARQQQAETSLFLTRRRVEQSVMEHYLAYRLRAEEMARWEQDAIRRFHEAAELGDRHYRLGSLPIATYLELQREYLEALNAILSLQSEALQSLQQLEVLTLVPLTPAGTPPVAPPVAP